MKSVRRSALLLLLAAPSAAAATPPPLVVDGIRSDTATMTTIHVHQGERRGFFIPQPSGDDLYLFWVETTPSPARSLLLPACADTVQHLSLPATLCTDPPPTGGRPPTGLRIARRPDGPTVEMVGYGRGTEQWVWQLIPAQNSVLPPDPSERAPRGWTWAAAAGGVGVPLFVPPLPEAPSPMIIGHRGAPGYLPDHTLEGYRLAVAQGADAIEPDLVLSKDGVLVVRHENELSQTTDVAARFPDRKRSATIDGVTVEGWFSEDYTLAELKTLRAVQPWPDRPHDHDGLYLIPTFDEVVALAAELSASTGRPITVVPETKHPSYFASIGLPFEPALDPALAAARAARVPVLLQSFELSNLERRADDPPRLLLIGNPTATIPGDTRTYGAVLADLPALRRDVEALGVPRELVWGPAGPTGFVAQAHAAGLKVYVWTFRAERPGPAGNGDLEAEIAAFLRLGVDGVFADQPDRAVKARARLTGPAAAQ